MKREEILRRLDFTVADSKKKRMIISTDLANEADDHFAVLHHLLTPSEDVKGIIAAHWEWTARIKEDKSIEKNVVSEVDLDFLAKIAGERGKTMEASYAIGEKLLKLSEIDDVPLLKGAVYEISDINNLPESPGADFIIQEALKDDERPLYVSFLGSITDLAIAYLKEPKIANRLTAIWIGGGSYPIGHCEYNLAQDRLAANIIFESQISLWQVPADVYSTVEVSQAELNDHIRPLGELGSYLCDQMGELNHRASQYATINQFPHGESWCLGDNPSVTVLLQGSGRRTWKEQEAVYVNKDYSYSPLKGKGNRMIRVYESVDAGLTLSDFYSKMKKCYKNKIK
ncbi:MAG: nucleoside hydrolase [Lactovum sp.]